MHHPNRRVEADSAGRDPTMFHDRGRHSLMKGTGRAVVGAAAIALLATACGSSGGAKPASSSTTAGSSAASTGASGSSSTTATPGGASGSSGKKVTVTFLNWADSEQNTHPGIDKMITKFESLHPNITIKSEPVSYTDVEHQALLEVKSGNAPDVAEMQGNYTLDLAASGALQPLGQFAKGSFTSSIIPSELKLGKINGQLLAIPWTVGPFGLWYNKTVMAKAGLNPSDPPKTISQLLTDLAAVKAKEPSVIPFGTDTTNRTYGLDQNWPFLETFNAVPFHGTTATADTSGMKQYLAFMQEIAKKGYTEVNKKGGYFRTPAAHNAVAFDIDGPYLRGVVESDTNENNTQFFKDWGLTTMPIGPSGKSYSTPTDHQLVMFKTAKNKQAAWTFMQWLATSDYAVANYTIPYEGSIPPLVNLGSQAKALLQSTPDYAVYTKQIIPTVVRPPWGAAYTNAYPVMMTSIQKVMTTSASPASVAASMQSNLKSALAGAG